MFVMLDGLNQCWTGIIFFLYTIQVSIMRISHFSLAVGYGYLMVIWSSILFG